MRRQRRGFTLIELMVSSAVTFVTVLAVSAAFLGYTQSFYTQAGIRGGQASLRQTHLMVVRNLRMAGYGMEPFRAFEFSPELSRESLTAVNRSDQLVFRMRNPSFNAFAASVSATSITLASPSRSVLRKGQILQVVCPGGSVLTYAQMSEDRPKGATELPLEAADAGGKFPRINDFTPSCFGTAGGSTISVFKIDVYHYSVRLIDDDGVPSTPGRPYLFRRHGLGEKKPLEENFGEPVAEDIEAMRVTFLREDGSSFVPDSSAPHPDYGTPLDSELRKNNSPANIRAVLIGLVARSSTRDAGASTSVMNQIPAFGRSGLDDTQEAGFSEDPITKLPVPHGFRRIVSEMTVQVRNMRSSQLPLPLYTRDAGSATVCKGDLPGDNLNCAGG
ncbi:prepilin-type N-terminal cleavage/methylation domain-containing protein [Melittangium boletus]|uniref:Prepilin-type N-terminal cleavage/methylation domain-containing protein n=1 Tax=Melittangium boletus DSM 14713 TaxID=1294270 RepID=A0A250IIU3_9BACT|nr:prepilin-type N-terminal cleavage/methylation domain-containing protein [Melittangium boletus]ATB31140.1 hypothetical protein MEBOL_004602 [Melittangium boletus DSM 14713]